MTTAHLLESSRTLPDGIIYLRALFGILILKFAIGGPNQRMLTQCVVASTCQDLMHMYILDIHTLQLYIMSTVPPQMIVEPEQRIADFAKAGADIISIHAEPNSTIHLDRTINMVRSDAAIVAHFITEN